MIAVMSWIVSRMLVLYLIAAVFIFTCLDIKTLEMRTKVRHLNDAIPDFSDLILFSKGQKSKKDVDWAPYRKYFDLILSYVPDDLVVKQLLGYVYFQQGNESGAIDFFKNAAVFKNQPLFWANYNLGVIYYKKGSWAQAAQYLFQAVAANAQVSLLLMKNSMVYRQIFLSPVFKYAIGDEIKQAQALAYVLLLSSLYHLKQYDKVVVVANLALANPDLGYKDAFYYYEALGFLGVDKIKEAVLLFEKTLELEKNNPEPYYYLADIYQKAGQLDQAKALFEASYALHQKNDPRFPYEASASLRFF